MKPLIKHSQYISNYDGNISCCKCQVLLVKERMVYANGVQLNHQEIPIAICDRCLCRELKLEITKEVKKDSKK